MRRPLADTLYLALLFVAIATAAWLSVRWQGRVDLSHGARASLSQASRDALAALDGPVTVESWARPSGGLREPIAAFVARYSALEPDLALRFVDPDADPGAARAQGITVDGEIVIRHGDRHEQLAELNEREFTRALLRLSRTGTRVIAFASGHGERRPDGAANHDFGDFAAALAAQGVRALRVDLATQALPANVDALVIADPRVPYGEAELAAVRAFVDAGGALWWLTEPASPAPLAPLARALGVQLLPGVVVDATGQSLGIGDPRFVALASYPAHPALRAFDLTTLFPQAAPLAALGSHAFAAAPLLRSGERSWNETGEVADAIRFDAGGDEIPGPHDLALALTRLSPRPDREQQRVVVSGDADFLANSYLGNGGNRALGLRLANWLVGDDALVDIAPVEVPDRLLALTPRATALIALVLLIGVPLSLLATGAAIAWRRRRR
jgi:ABC-type uncharacterized transport system involved in gliding motility auxiliary subunit